MHGYIGVDAGAVGILHAEILCSPDRLLDDVQTKVEELVKKVNKAASKDSINDSEMQIAKKVLQKCTALFAPA